MEDLDDGIEDGLSSFHFNSIIQLFTTPFKHCETKLLKSFHIISYHCLNETMFELLFRTKAIADRCALLTTFISNQSNRRPLCVVDNRKF